MRNKSAISKLHATVQTDEDSDKCSNIRDTTPPSLVLTLFEHVLQKRKGWWYLHDIFCVLEKPIPENYPAQRPEV